MYAIMACHFQILYFFKCSSEWIVVYFRLLCVLNFSHVVYPFGFSVMFPSFISFCSQIVLLPCHLAVGLSSCILPLIFRCYGIFSYICIILFCLDIFLVYLILPVASTSFLLAVLFFFLLFASVYNVMAEGFRFMPLRFVRLRIFRLSTWVS